MIGQKFKIKPTAIAEPNYPKDYPQDPNRVFTVLNYSPSAVYEVETVYDDDGDTAFLKESEITWLTSPETDLRDTLAAARNLGVSLPAVLKIVGEVWG